MSAQAFFGQLETHADPHKLEGIDHSYLFDIEGEGAWLVVVRDRTVAVSEGPGDADLTITVSPESFERWITGLETPAMAYALGKLTLRGDLTAAESLQSLF
jgi:putative sterol carrier protein